MIEIRNVGPVRAEAVALTLARAFEDDPVMRWIFPDEPGRTALLPGLMGMFVAEALATDVVQVAEDGDSAVGGAAVWMVRGGGTPAHPATEPPADYAPYLERLAVIGERLAVVHPMEERHLFLCVVGVPPGARGRGIGGALLKARLADTAGLPAYLEATSSRNAALYERHGFRAYGSPIELPVGPSILPMWRDTL